jgi:type IV pilus assembly protein PilA
MRNKQKGFSLIELLIVVAIILIIAAIAIPNLLRSKMAANEASAVASLRTYNTAIVAYQTTYNTDPSTDFSQLGPVTSGTPSASAADLVDSLLGIANPAKKSGVIRQTTDGSTPTVTSNPIG